MSLVWPAADPFTHGSPAYGTNVIGYLGARVNIGGFLAGRLMASYGGATCRKDNQGDNTGNPVGFMRRQAFPANVRVSLVSRKHAKLGTVSNVDLKGHGVLARITAGTLAGDATTSVRLENLTAYVFRAQWSPGVSAIRFQLFRYVAGASTLLATVDDVTQVSGAWNIDVELALEVTTDGSGNVVLKGYVTNYATSAPLAQVVYQPGGVGGVSISTPGASQPGTPLVPLDPASVQSFTTAQTAEVITFTDTSGSKITAAGRCGFFMDSERSVASPQLQALSVAKEFTVSDLTGEPVVVWADDWTRAAPALAESITDIFNTVGRSLGSDFTADQASTAPSTQLLKRATAEEAAESPLTFDDGQACTLDGVDDHLDLVIPLHTFKAQTVPNAQLEVTIAVWAKVDENRDGNEFYAAITNLVSPSNGFAFGWRTGTGSNFKMQARLGKSTSGSITTLESPERAIAAHIGQAWLYAITYKANSNPSTGEGRLRFYVGRLGVATLLGEAVVPADTRPGWPLNLDHYLGKRHGFTGTAAETFFKGVLDEAHVFYRELTLSEVGLVANQNTPGAAAFPPLELVGGWHMDAFTNVSGQDRTAPWYASAAGGVPSDTADWLRLIGATIATAGLVPVAPASAFHAFHQRPADSDIQQSRKVRVKLATDASIAGILARGTVGAVQALHTAYRMDVAAGSPAPIAIYRVRDGVATKMAHQNPSTGTVAISAGAFVTAKLAVLQVPGTGPTGPVQLKPYINGVLVPMVSVEPSKTVVDLAGNVVDISDDRILSGGAEGFHGFIDGGQTRFDDWDQDAADVPGDPTAFPNFVLPAADAGVTGNLATVLAPDWDVEMVLAAPRHEQRFESGHVARYPFDGYESRRFRLSKRSGTTAEITALRSFWDAHKGSEIPFAWDPAFFLDEQQDGVFHFERDSLEDSMVGNVRVTTFVIQEDRASA